MSVAAFLHILCIEMLVDVIVVTFCFNTDAAALLLPSIPYFFGAS